jgi:putative salt-induced outer membrane protein YdiY
MKKLLVLSLAASAILAAEGLEQSFDLGFTNTTGNTKTTNLNAKYALGYSTLGYNDQKLNIKFSLAAFYAENEGEKSNEEYTSNLDLEQYVYDGWLGYFSFDWLRNPDFKNYDGKYDFGIGVGKEIYKTDTSSLKLKLGVGYTVIDFADNTSTDTFATLNQEIDYTNKINPLSLFYFNLKALEGFDDFTKNYEIDTKFGLKFNLTKTVHAVLEEQISYDNLPPAGYKKTDTKTIVRLGISF